MKYAVNIHAPQMMLLMIVSQQVREFLSKLLANFGQRLGSGILKRKTTIDMFLLSTIYWIDSYHVCI